MGGSQFDMSAKTEAAPLVSIGLAVFNGEKYLASAIDSILSQTFTDFELVISDNASTDSTQEIAQRYAQQDNRVRYVRNRSNIGGANNENRTFELSRGKYFRLAAHDDVCHPRLIEACVAELDEHPDVVLCYTDIVEIDENGTRTGVFRLRKGTESTAVERLRGLVKRDYNCEPTYGLIRADVMRTVRPQQNYTDSDRVWLCELAAKGRFAVVPEPLFCKRYHAGNIYVDTRARTAWFNPEWNGRIAVPNWLQLGAHLRIAVTIRGSALTKLRLVGIAMRWAFDNRFRLAKDVLVSTMMLLRIRRPVPQSEHNWL